MELFRLACGFRALQLYAHHAHLFSKGEMFFQDHEFFGDLYGFAEGSFDSLMERGIGNKNKISYNEIISLVSKFRSEDGESFYKVCLDLIEEIIEGIESFKNQSKGTDNLLADLTDKLEGYVYKISRRMEK